MLLGRVIGEVWATRKDPRLADLRFVVVSAIDRERRPSASIVVAVDAVGAGPGEIVLLAQGSSARQSDLTTNKPVDAVVMAIVDDYDLSERDWAAFDARSLTPGTGR